MCIYLDSFATHPHADLFNEDDELHVQIPRDREYRFHEQDP